jgi:hypothetical protein
MHRNLLHQYGGRRSWMSIWNSFLLALLFCALAPVVFGQDEGLKSLRAEYGVRAIPQDVENLQPLPSGSRGPLRLVSQEKP